MPSARYVHPEFGYFCPTPRLRRRMCVLFACMIVGGIGFAMLRAGLDLTAAHSAASDNTAMMARAEIASEAGRVSDTAAIGLRPTLSQGLKTCEEDTWAYLDGRCAAGKKPRVVRVQTNRPGLATIPLGRGAAPVAGAAEPASAVAAAVGRKGDHLPSEAGPSAQADVPLAAAVATEPSQQPAAAPKKPQKTAHSQNRRREREFHPAPVHGYASVPDQRYGPFGGGGFFTFYR
jgi:hypothetical protein